MSAGRERAEERHVITYALRSRIFDRYNGTCAHCGRKLYRAGNYTVEHIIPLSKGGQTVDRNLCALCYMCNREKEDDIVEPEDYYLYATKEQKTEIRELYQDYLDRFDWLTKTNLFKADRFRMKTKAVIRKPIHRSGHIYKEPFVMPVTAKVYKVRPDQIMEYLGRYRETLEEPDRALLLDSPEDIDAPFYFLEVNGKVLFMFSTYIHENLDKKFVVYIDFFVSPDVRDIEKVTDPSLAMAVMSLTDEIQESLGKGTPGTLIQCAVRTPESDVLAVRALHAMAVGLRGGCREVVSRPLKPDGTEMPGTGKIHGCVMMLFQGDERDIRKAMDELGVDTKADLGRALVSGEQSLDRRIRRNRAQSPYNRPKKKQENEEND